MKAYYPLRFINIMLNELQKDRVYGNEGFIIPVGSPKITKPLNQNNIF